MSLKKQTISGAIWTFADSFLVRGMSFVANLVLARVLGPREFGLIGMIAIFIAIGTSLIDSGLSASLIRTKNISDEDYSTVFVINLLISFCIYGLIYVIAPYIAVFYEQDILTNLIRVYCLGFIITALTAVQLAILNREMKFKKITKINAPATIIGVVVGLATAYNGFGVWSIVWMYLTNQACFSLFIWATSSWKPSWKVSRSKLRYHYNFGYKLMLSGLIDQIFSNSYNVIIGKYFNAQTLGYYERAKTFNTYPSSVLSGVIGKVTYPMLAKIQDDKKRVAKVYREILQLTFFIIAPIMLGTAAVAKPLFLLILGEAWLPAVPFFQILSIAFMLYPIHAFNINVLKVYGRSDLFLKLEIIKKVVITVSILITFQFGLIALVWSSVFTSITALLINTHYSSKMIQYSIKQQLKDMVPVLLSTGIIFITMNGLVKTLDSYSLMFQLGIASIVGFITYISFHYGFKTKPMVFALTLLKNKK